jgi:alanyl-tRNA synthetase
MCALLKTTTHQVKDRLSLLIEEHKLMSSQLKAHRRASVRHLASELMQKAEKIGAYDFICDVVAVEQEDMQQLLEDLGSLSKTFVAALATKTTDRCQLFVKVAAEPLRHGVHAGNIIKEIASFIGGKGGGKADSAQAGGTTPAGLAEAFDAAKKIVRDMC